MQILKIVLFSILFLSISPIHHIYALDEGFYSTISFTIGELPSREDISYEPMHIEGEYTSDVLSHTVLSHLTQDNYKSRIFDKMTMLAIPPLSQVDIGYYWYNYTPDEVDIETIRIPLSREHIPNGDMTQLFYENPNQEFEEGITYSDGPSRGGKYVDIEGVGLLSSDMDSGMSRGVVIESFTMKPSLELYEWKVKVLSENLSELTLYVRNITKESLQDIWIFYDEGSHLIMDFDEYEEHQMVVHKRCVVGEESVNCGIIRLMDRNTKAHCMVRGSDWDNYLKPESISVWSKIEGEWIGGARFQPDRESLCIRRLPHVYKTKELIAEYNPPIPPSTQEEYWEDILGLEILPITNHQSGRDNFWRLIKPLFTDNLNIL
ncbi:hypothetical protein K8R20_01590 [bacterium]|nr:hypothetical protein [bacterium]